MGKGLLVFARDFGLNKQVSIGVACRGAGIAGGHAVIGAATGPADTRDFGVKPQPVRRPGEIAMQPIARQRDPIKRGNLAPRTKPSGGLIHKSRAKIEGPVWVGHLGLTQDNTGKRTGPPQPGAGTPHVLGGIDRADGQTRNRKDTLGADGGWCLNPQCAKA